MLILMCLYEDRRNTTTTLFHDLDDLQGSWVDDENVDKAIESMHQIDEELWV